MDLFWDVNQVLAVVLLCRFDGENDYFKRTKVQTDQHIV